MKIFVKAKVGTRHEKVATIDGKLFEVSTRAKPVDGQANQAIIRLLAEFLHLPPTKIELISGHRSKNKVFEI